MRSPQAIVWADGRALHAPAPPSPRCLSCPQLLPRKNMSSGGMCDSCWIGFSRWSGLVSESLREKSGDEWYPGETELIELRFWNERGLAIRFFYPLGHGVWSSFEWAPAGLVLRDLWLSLGCPRSRTDEILGGKHPLTGKRFA